MHIVICSGVMRSGSTWSFNACRAVMSVVAEHLRIPLYAQYLEGYGIEDLVDSEKVTEPGAAVFKTHTIGYHAHRLVRQGHVANVCTVRDPRDCVASRRQFKPDEPLNDSIDLVRGSFIGPRSCGQGTRFIDYPRILSEPGSVIVELLTYLKVVLPDNEAFARELASQLSIEAMAARSDAVKGIDPDYEIHTNHIHGGTVGRWRDEFTVAEQRRVDSALTDELAWYQAFER